jgi:Ni,Fe-hydrogenase I small subunit
VISLEYHETIMAPSGHAAEIDKGYELEIVEMEVN